MVKKLKKKKMKTEHQMQKADDSLNARMKQNSKVEVTKIPAKKISVTPNKADKSNNSGRYKSRTQSMNIAEEDEDKLEGFLPNFGPGSDHEELKEP